MDNDRGVVDEHARQARGAQATLRFTSHEFVEQISRIRESAQSMSFRWDCFRIWSPGLAKMRVQDAVELSIGGTILESIAEISQRRVQHLLVLISHSPLNQFGPLCAVV